MWQSPTAARSKTRSCRRPNQAGQLPSEYSGTSVNPPEQPRRTGDKRGDLPGQVVRLCRLQRRHADAHRPLDRPDVVRLLARRHRRSMSGRLGDCREIRLCEDRLPRIIQVHAHAPHIEGRSRLAENRLKRRDRPGLAPRYGALSLAVRARSVGAAHQRHVRDGLHRLRGADALSEFVQPAPGDRVGDFAIPHERAVASVRAPDAHVHFDRRVAVHAVSPPPTVMMLDVATRKLSVHRPVALTVMLIWLAVATRRLSVHVPVAS